MWILVDTNVYLDYFLDREGADEAQKFFINCHKTKSKTFVTSMSLRDIEYAAHKYTHDKAVSKRILASTYELCSKVIGITEDDAINSIYSDIDDYEDSLIVEAAKRSMINLIVTNNKKDFQNSRFPVFTPKEYNEIVERDI